MLTEKFENRMLVVLYPCPSRRLVSISKSESLLPCTSRILLLPRNLPRKTLMVPRKVFPKQQFVFCPPSEDFLLAVCCTDRWSSWSQSGRLAKWIVLPGSKGSTNKSLTRELKQRSITNRLYKVETISPGKSKPYLFEPIYSTTDWIIKNRQRVRLRDY